MSGRRRIVAIVFVIAIVASTLTGCITVRVKMGDRPDISALQQLLTIGESTRDDVVQVVGEPSGTGRAKLPMQPKPIDMWHYYYAEGTRDDSRQLMLFVYLEDDVYQGYMWWSSFDE